MVVGCFPLGNTARPVRVVRVRRESSGRALLVVGVYVPTYTIVSTCPLNLSTKDQCSPVVCPFQSGSLLVGHSVWVPVDLTSRVPECS